MNYRNRDLRLRTKRFALRIIRLYVSDADFISKNELIAIFTAIAKKTIRREPINPIPKGEGVSW